MPRLHPLSQRYAAWIRRFPCPWLVFRILGRPAHAGNDRCWVGLPGKPLLDRAGQVQRDEQTGKVRYVPVIVFDDKNLLHRFSDAAARALDLYAHGWSDPKMKPRPPRFFIDGDDPGLVERTASSSAKSSTIPFFRSMRSPRSPQPSISIALRNWPVMIARPSGNLPPRLRCRSHRRGRADEGQDARHRARLRWTQYRHRADLAARRARRPSRLRLRQERLPLARQASDRPARSTTRPEDRAERRTSATADSGILKHWFGNLVPAANLAVITSILIVLDVDPRHDGLESLRAESENGSAETWTVVTGSGGAHLLPPSARPGARLPIIAENIIKAGGTPPFGPGIDIPGYVIAPPSRHICGRHYEWDDHPSDYPLAEAPAWIVDRLTGRAASPERRDIPPSGQNSTGRPSPNYPRRSRRRVAGKLLRAVSLDRALPRDCSRLERHYCRPPIPDHELPAIFNRIATRSRTPEAGTSE